MNDHFFGPPVEKLLKLVGEILVEVSVLRRLQEAQVKANVETMITIDPLAGHVQPLDFHGVAYNYSYE